MSEPNILEIKKNPAEIPFAELLADAVCEKLDGSFRVSTDAGKSIIYLKAGAIVFAASNLREFKFFEYIVRQGLITQENLPKITDPANDLVLAQELLKNGILNQVEIEQAISGMIGAITARALGWQQGEIVFNPLVRARADIQYKIPVSQIIIKSAKAIDSKLLDERARLLKDNAFTLAADSETDFELSPHEGFVLSRFEAGKELSVAEISTLTGLPDAEILRILYILRLSGFIRSIGGSAIFTTDYVNAVKLIKLRLRENPAAAAPNALNNAAAAGESSQTKTFAPEKAVSAEVQLEEYLERVENAKHFYDMLGIPVGSTASTVKKSYFALAKRYHPDKYHNLDDGKMQTRIQDVFVRVAKAYDTLKNEDRKANYDLQVAEFLNDAQAVESDPTLVGESVSVGSNDNLEKGVELIIKGYYKEAALLLSQAVKVRPDDARCRAYYGKALSFDESRKYLAEQEILTAVKLDGEKADYRLMLAEFYIKFRQPRRAEGELNRLLAIHPNNETAKKMLVMLSKE